MKLLWKRMLSLALAVIMVLSMAPAFAIPQASAENATEARILGVAVESGAAIVSYVCEDTDAVMAVGIYEAGNGKMLQYQNADLAVGEDSISIPLEQPLPESYEVRAFLLKKGAMEPLGTEYRQLIGLEDEDPSQANQSNLLDTDNDGLPDYLEEQYKSSIELADTDGDQLDDCTEVLQLGTDPTLADSDDDGISDYDSDFDGDGITNGRELQLKTSPVLADTDFDGLSDSKEDSWGTDPLNEDTDGDGVSDFDEVKNGYNPLIKNAVFVDVASAQEISEFFPVTASAEAEVDGSAYGSVSVTPVTAAQNPLLSANIPGYLGHAFDFGVSSEIKSGTLMFSYDPALGELGDDFQPRIYYFNEETQELEELENQIVENGQVFAEVPHFSTYILLNKAEYDAKAVSTPTLFSTRASYHLQDYYDEIYTGQILVAPANYDLVGYDLAGNSDFDGDTIPNEDEIQIVSQAGRLVVVMKSNPVLADTDGDGLLDNVDSQPLVYNYSQAAGRSIENLLLGSQYASYLLYDEIVSGDKNAFNDLFSVVGYVSYGSKKDIAKGIWADYLNQYCDTTMETLADQELKTVVNNECLSMITGYTCAIAKGIENGQDVQNLIDLRNDVVKFRNASAKSKNRAIFFSDEMQDSFSEIASLFKKNGGKKTFRVTDVKSALGDAPEIVSLIELGMDVTADFSKSCENIALLNANAEAYAGSIELFRHLSQYGEEDWMCDAADEMVKILTEEAKDISGARWSAVQRVIGGGAFAWVMTSLKLTPYGSFVVTALEHIAEAGAEIAYKQNVVVANECLVRSATVLAKKQLMYNVGTDKWTTKNPGTAAALLTQLTQLRLYGEMKVAEVLGSKNRLKEQIEHIVEFAEELDLTLSDELLADCKRTTFPSVTIRIKDNVANPENGDFSSAGGTYIVFVDGQKHYPEAGLLDQLVVGLAPGRKYTITVAGSCGAGWQYQTQEVTVSEGTPATLTFNFSYSTFLRFYLHRDGVEGEYISNATVYVRKGTNTKTGALLATKVNATQNNKWYKLILPESGEYTLEISCPGYNARYVNVTVPVSTYYKIALTPVPVSGRVVEKGTGKPVGGARLEFYSEGKLCLLGPTLKSDEQGNITGAPKDMQHIYNRVKISAMYYEDKVYSVSYSVIEKQYVLGDKELTPCSSYEVTGNVSKPLGGVTVRVLNPVTHEVLAQTTASSTGTYTFTLPVGEYLFEFSASGYETQKFVHAIPRTNNQPLPTYELTAMPVEFSITHAGKTDVLSASPIKMYNGKAVQTWIIDSSMPWKIATNKGDWFTLWVGEDRKGLGSTFEAGKTKLKLNITNGSDTERQGWLAFEVGGQRYEVEIRQTPCAITGKVVDENGKDLSGVKVVLKGDYTYETTTGSDGTFTCNVPNAYYTVTLSKDGVETTVPGSYLVDGTKDKVDIGTQTLQETAEEEVASGTCGDNLTWILSGGGTLTISGSGKMEHWYTREQVPWYSNRKTVKRVIVDRGVTTIGQHAFHSCSNLTSVIIPDGVTNIGDAAFHSCSSLSSVAIPDSVITIGDYTFFGCVSLTSVALPDSVTAIGDYTFCECEVLSSVTFGNNVTSIGDLAFFYCTSLSLVTIPDSVTTIGNSAFEQCLSLTAVKLPDSLMTIGYGAFCRCVSLYSVVIGNSVTNIGEWAFYECYRLTAVTIGNSVTTIGDYAFSCCIGLTDVYFKGNAPTVGTHVFDEGVTLYYIPSMSNWIFNVAYDLEAGTWNGYPLKPWDGK